MSAIGTSEYMKIRRYVMNLILHAGKDLDGATGSLSLPNIRA